LVGKAIKFRPPNPAIQANIPILAFAKAYGIKVRCYGEHVGEHIENLIRTHWELEGTKTRQLIHNV
jgi:hypothetical protein